MKGILILFLFITSFSFSQQLIVNGHIHTVSCTDIYAEGDAVDPCNETNSVGSWSTAGSGTQQIINESDGDGGTYSLEVTVPTIGFNDRTAITLPALTDNATYTIECRGKADQNDGYVYFFSGFDGGGFAVGASVLSNGSYGNLITTGKISDGTGPVIYLTSDQSRPDVVNLAWIKITKTADP